MTAWLIIEEAKIRDYNNGKRNHFFCLVYGGGTIDRKQKSKIIGFKLSFWF